MIASLPMYDWPELRPQTDAMWQVFRQKFAASGFQPPSSLSRSDDESEGWLHPALFFSQTCGYPFITRLEGKVQLLGTPHFDAEGWIGPNYSSAVILRKDFDLSSLEESRPVKFAYNSPDSLSGFRCLSPLVGNPERWFERSIKSGGHRNSALMVSQGQADIAAIDSLCWHLFKRVEPTSAQKLRILQWTPPLPGLPYITNLSWSKKDLHKLREAIGQAVIELASSNLTPDIPLVGLSALEPAVYQSIKSL
ncbi:MAG: phosphate/phosphite/phosphonate ABC transporter substrate-binding protein [Rhizobiaceae bacterium]